MKKILSSCLAILGLLSATSCSEDQPLAPLAESQQLQEITFTATADQASRSLTAYRDGTDIKTMRVSAWYSEAKGVGYYSRIYDTPHQGNAPYFTEDLLTRTGVSGNNGIFTYENNVRYWPANNGANVQLSFFAAVDNDKLPAYNDATKQEGNFKWYFEDFPTGDLTDGMPARRPGLNWIEQHDLGEMPDILQAVYTGVYAHHDSQNPPASTTDHYPPFTDETNTQRNVHLSFTHILSKVIIKAKVENPTLRIYITDASIVGLVDKGRMTYGYTQYIEGQGGHYCSHTSPTWHYETGDALNLNTTIHCPIYLTDASRVDDAEHRITEQGILILDNTPDANAVSGVINPNGNNMKFSDDRGATTSRRVSYAMAEQTIVGLELPAFNYTFNNVSKTMSAQQQDLLTIPYNYSKNETKPYIKLTCYVYNKAGDTFNPELDNLIFGNYEGQTKDSDGKNVIGYLEAKDIYIPFGFKWDPATVNTYTIKFNRGNGGITDPTKPNSSALIKIGVDATVTDWHTGENKTGNETINK